MKVKFERSHLRLWSYEGRVLPIIYYRLVYSPLTSNLATFKVIDMDAQDDDSAHLPGLSLQEYLDSEGLSYAAFSRKVPCAPSYPRLLAQGLARPSYRMAVRIERVTGGAVPRERWFPPGEATREALTNKDQHKLLEDFEGDK